ncbi:MAG: phosphotransferase [Ardenticatenaceae bacterium]|nr:phosphotransferase [Ardenticatenaceae bacterium]
MTTTIPDKFAQTIREGYGDKGAVWLENLPSLIANYEERWSLTVRPPFANLSYNYAAPAVLADGTECVLKLGVVNPELLCEIEALRLYDGHGIVKLLQADPEAGILLLEHLHPGIPLRMVAEDEAATAIAAQVMQQLWQPVLTNYPFPTVADWARGMERLRREFDGGTGPFPKRLVKTAESLFAELLPSQAEPVLLHGDLHHWNILRATRHPWLALDPKGVVGEPAYEVGAWLRNPVDVLADWSELSSIQARRIDQFAEMLGFDRQRLIGWGIAQAVLSAWWSYEDHGYGWDTAIFCAESLLELL